LKLEARVRTLERAKEEHERRLSALERMHQCADHLRYHENLTWEAIEYWRAQGITNESIDRYKLGWCERCPTDREGRPSYTIPVTYRDKLINIRHRLYGAESDKYRPHMAGLGVQLFNADYVHQDLPSLLIVEGEKKSIVVAQEGFANVGIIGQQGFKEKWAPYFKQFGTVHVALDPDASGASKRLAALFDGRGRVVDLPVKADDFFVVYGGTRDDFENYVKLGKRVH
jgi:hypothetical protein